MGIFEELTNIINAANYQHKLDALKKTAEYQKNFNIDTNISMNEYDIKEEIIESGEDYIIKKISIDRKLDDEKEFKNKLILKSYLIKKLDKLNCELDKLHAKIGELDEKCEEITNEIYQIEKRINELN